MQGHIGDAMAKPPATWKQAERRIAEFFGGQRRGADYRKRDGTGGKNDVIAPGGFSIEIKHGKRITYELMRSAVEQARAAREHPDDIPVAVVHKAGQPYNESLVIVRLDDFRDFFVGGCK